MRVRILSFLLGACLAMFGSCSLAEEAISDAYVWDASTASINIDRVTFLGNDYGITLTYWKDPVWLKLTSIYPGDSSTANQAIYDPDTWLLTIPRVQVGDTVFYVELELWPPEECGISDWCLELVQLSVVE